MMIIEQKEGYIYVSSNDDNFNDYALSFKEEHNIIEQINVIVDISSNFKVKVENLFVFLQFAQYHKDNGTTFVVICKDVDIDSLPEEFNVVPTLQEAEDILEMENIERDLIS